MQSPSLATGSYLYVLLVITALYITFCWVIFTLLRTVHFRVLISCTETESSRKWRSRRSHQSFYIIYREWLWLISRQDVVREAACQESIDGKYRPPPTSRTLFSPKQSGDWNHGKRGWPLGHGVKTRQNYIIDQNDIRDIHSLCRSLNRVL